MINKNKKLGFTLIELIIAIGVFTVGILGAFSLALANLRIARENQDRVIAADLAREGLELVRNIRDTNWLRLQANEDCNTNDFGLQLCTPANYMQKGVYAIDIYDNYPSPLQNITDKCGDVEDLATCNCEAGYNCNITIDNGNYYSHIGTTVTSMTRKIGIRPICFDGNSESVVSFPNNDCSDLAGSFEQIGIEVTVRVDWTRHGQSDNVVVKELLYNWRR